MKIDRVELSNFRQYFGKQRISFSTDDIRNVTVVHGVNGAGKTSLFLALNWCLYGEGVENIGQVISKEAVAQTRHGNIVEAKVEVIFTHDGRRYTASRKLTGQKQADGSVLEAYNIAEFMLLRTPPSGIVERVQNPIGMMNMILPANVRTYFFFDGEKIDNFARPEQAGEVEKSIYQVLDLDTLTRAMRHLTSAAQNLRAQLKQTATGDLQKLVEQDEQARAEETRLNQKRDELKREYAAIQTHLEDVNKQLREFEATQELQKRYDELSEQINDSQQQYSIAIKTIRDVISRSYLRISSDPIKIALDLLEEKRRRGEIPSNIREQFVNDLLARQICICGRPFSEDDDAHAHLLHLLKNTTSSSLEDDVIDTTGRLRGLLERSDKQANELDSAMKSKVKSQERTEQFEAQRDDIQRQMRVADEQEIRDLSRQREVYSADLDTNRTGQVRTDMELEAVRTRIKELEKQIEQAKKGDKKAHSLTRRMELAQKSADQIQAVYGTFASNKRIEIEKETRRIFQSLAWKGEHFQEVRLTEDYQLQVFDRYGLPARPELSAGERQVLSLSFITAMAMVAQREAPIIMDTPFGRLSSGHREAITLNLPALAPQIALFITDEELRDKARDNIAPRIGAEYLLRFDPKTSCTTIEEMS